MKILFLAAKLQTIEPFGIMSLIPHLYNSGHDVSLMEAEATNIKEKVEAYQPEIIAYSVCTGSHNFYLELNRYLKNNFEFISVFGGPHPTFFPEMINECGVDAICRGEGDLAFVEFCNQLKAKGILSAVRNFSVKINGNIETLPLRPLIENLDILPFPDRKLYYGISDEISEYRVRSFLASRGCPFYCTYCFNHSMDEIYNGSWKNVRVRTPQNLIDEIELIVTEYPTDFIAFRESIFPLKTKWLGEFAEKYNTKIKLPFYCHVKLDLLTEQNIILLSKAGCHSVNAGIETGNQLIRKELLGRKMDNKKIISACKLLRKYGIKILANNMLGLPGCSFKNDLETLALNQKCQPDYSLAMLWQPYPGTQLTKYAETNGYFDGNYKNLDFTYYNLSHINFKNRNEKKRIENLQKLFAVASNMPFLTPLIKLLTHLPPNKIFKAIFKTVYLIFHQTEIFPNKISWTDWKYNFLHIIKES